MTVSTTNNRIAHDGNGVTTVFSFPYKFIAKTDIKVYVDGALISSGYTVGTPTDSGADITFAVAPAAAASIVIISDPDMLQASALPGTGPFPSSTVERMSDKLTLIVQRLRDLVNRSLTLPDGLATSVSTVLPNPEANKVIAWNSTADALVSQNAADLATAVIGSNTVIDNFTGNGSQTAFTLSADPMAKNNLAVFISGVYQEMSQFSLSGLTLTFSSAPPNGTTIQVRQQLAVTYPVSSIAAGSVNSLALADGAVTEQKIADGAVTLAKTTGFGTAAAKNTGTSAGNVVEVQTGGKLPALDASNLTNVPTELPDQSGNSGKYLTTNGSAASWGDVAGVRAFANFNGTLSGTITPRRASGIASIVKTATGKYTVTLSSALADFVCVGMCRTSDSGNSAAVVSVEYSTTPTSTVVNIATTNPSTGFVDSAYVYLTFF